MLTGLKSALYRMVPMCNIDVYKFNKNFCDISLTESTTSA